MENKKIYIVKNYGNWDGTWSDITAFDSRDKARQEFAIQVKDAIEIYKENYNEEEFVVDESNDCCEIYLNRWYDDNHHIIEIDTIELN